MYSFTPRSDTEINEIKNRRLMADGIYPFVIKAMETTVSKTNKTMIKATYAVYDNTGAERTVTDYLLLTDEMIFKLKHLCDTTGLEEEYATGNPEKICLAAIGRSGDIKIGIKKGTLRNDGTLFDDQNVVKDYIKQKKSDQKQSVANEAPFNDDIAF